MALDTGQTLVDLAKASLSGYSNASTKDAMLKFVNEGKDEVWAILKAENDNWFVTSKTLSLTTSTREYTLDASFRGMKFIECTTSGYETLKFTEKELSDPAFRLARKSSTAEGPQTGVGMNEAGEYYYALVGANDDDATGQITLMLAQYPEAALTLKYWFVQSLPDLDLNTTLYAILQPYSKKIADYAAKRVMLGQQDMAMFEEWKKEFSSDVLSIVVSVGPRNEADPEFVQDFLG